MEAAARAEKMKESGSSDETEYISPGGPGNTSTVEDVNDPVNGRLAKEESSLADLLTSAYGKKETEVGKVIRMTA